VIKFHKLLLANKITATTFGYTLDKEMNLPVKAAIATLLLIPNEKMNESIQSCVREVRTSKVCAYIVVLYQTNL